MAAREQTVQKMTDPKAAVPSAQELRMQLLEKQMAELERERKAKAAADQKLTEFTDDFIRAKVQDMAPRRRSPARRPWPPAFQTRTWCRPSAARW